MKFSSVNYSGDTSKILQRLQTFFSVLISKSSPTLFWAISSRKPPKTLTGSKQILILDCDTDLDIEVVTQVYKNLVSKGINPILAVPGEMLEKGTKVYREIFNSGAEFINHGYIQHSVVDSQRTSYKSTYFYHDITEADVILDITRGHETFYKIFNVC